MIDKKQIITEFNRIIGNNQEVTDDTHMDLVDECSDYAETLVNKLFIADVSQQRELLIAYETEVNKPYNISRKLAEEKVDRIMKAINCG